MIKATTNPNLHEASDLSLDVPTEVKSNIELQVEQDTGDIRVLQTQVSDLQMKCSQFEELANEGSIWKEKYIRLQKELELSRTNGTKIIKGKTENRGTISYAAIAVPIVIVLEIVVLILVFVIKPRQLKPVGIFLIVVSAIVLIGTSWYGILLSHYFYLQVY